MCVTAPSVRAVVSLDVADSAVAVVFIAATLSVTVLSTPSTLPRNQTMASSTAARRAACSLEQSAFLLGRTALGDVVMGSDPVPATRVWRD